MVQFTGFIESRGKLSTVGTAVAPKRCQAGSNRTDRGFNRNSTLKKEKANMLWTILVVLLVLWLLGFGYGIGPFIHLLLLVALVILVINLVTGRRTV
jgi:hypothetical protein